MPASSTGHRPPWRTAAVCLIAVGALGAVAGVSSAVVAMAAAGNSVRASQRIPTLPVHTSAQYTQHVEVPDYTGLWVGLLIAGVGAVVLLVGAVTAFARSRTA